jgi:hypothetical protein
MVQSFRARTLNLDTEQSRSAVKVFAGAVPGSANRYVKYDPHPVRTLNRYRARSSLR